MADVKVFEVFTVPAEDRLIVRGHVDGVWTVGYGWLSWTHNYWHPDEHPAELELEDGLDDAKREKLVQKHRDAILKLRRPMNQDELRAYCETLLLEARPAVGVETGLPVEPIIDGPPV